MVELNDFFARLDDALRAEGLAYGPDVWLRVHQFVERLQQREALPSDKRQLLPMLRPLFCRNPKEQVRFTFLFEQCLNDKPQSLTSVNRITSPQQKAISGSLKKAQKIEQYWWLGGVFLVVIIAAVIVLSWPRPPQSVEPTEQSAVKTETTETRSSSEVTPTDATKTVPIVDTIAPRPQPEPEPEAPERFPWYLIWLLYSLPWFAAAWWLGKTYIQKLALAREPGSGDSLLNQLPFEQPFTPIWGGVEAEQSLRELRAARLIPTHRLDVDATVEATARSGDYFLPVYRTRRIAPEHVLLVRSVHRHDQQAELAEELAARFTSLGLQISVYRFRDDPRWLARWDGKTDKDGQGTNDYFQLDQIIAKHGNVRLLVVSEADILFHPYSGEPRDWLAALSPWQDKAWLYPYDARKPHAKLLTEHNFLVLPLSRDSLPELVSHLTAAQPSKLTAPETSPIELPDIIETEPDGWLDERPPYGIGLADLEWELEHYLGTYGLRLLRAIAVYPKPHWKLTLALDYLLFGRYVNPPAWREQRLSRLSRLPWLKHGFMPNWLREHLLVHCDADERQHVVNVWQSLFGQLSQKGGVQSLQLDFSMPSKRQIKLYWDKLRAIPQSDAVNDPIFAYILMGGKFSWLDFHLPHKLAGRLPYAQRTLNLRPLLEAVTVVALGMAAIFGVINMTIEPQSDQAQWIITIHYQPDTQALAVALQRRLQELTFQVPQLIEPASVADTTNTITYAPGGRQAAEHIRHSLAWLTYGAQVGLNESAALNQESIQVKLAQTYRHGAAFNDTLYAELETDLPFEPEMIRIEPGEFLMDSSETEARRSDSEGPQHKVTITYAFEIGKYEVTFDEYDVFAKATRRKLPDDQGWGRGRRPVINVSWSDAQAYVKWLSEQTGKKYRLPTKAEWEYVARAKTTTAYWWGDDIGKNNAVCNGCGSQWDGKQTAPVGSLQPNPFGLYDTAGNVWEWVEGCWYDHNDKVLVDGFAWLEADGGDCTSSIESRGGSWFNGPEDLRSANRSILNMDNFVTPFIGFRIARDF